MRTQTRFLIVLAVLAIGGTALLAQRSEGRHRATEGDPLQPDGNTQIESLTGTVDQTAITGNRPISQPVTVTNFPDPQQVAGTVSVGNFPAVQEVMGTVTVANFPSSQSRSQVLRLAAYPGPLEGCGDPPCRRWISEPFSTAGWDLFSAHVVAIDLRTGAPTTLGVANVFFRNFTEEPFTPLGNVPTDRLYTVVGAETVVETEVLEDSNHSPTHFSVYLR